jgi:hypothetical protein
MGALSNHPAVSLGRSFCSVMRETQDRTSGLLCKQIITILVFRLVIPRDTPFRLEDEWSHRLLIIATTARH